MKPPPQLADETRRLETLRRYNLLDGPPEEALDDLAAFAARICETPISLISLIDEKRQWFKSKIGLSTNETPRDISFCAHTIRQPDLFIVPDAVRDERFADNPLVTGNPNIRFYAGAPLVTPTGLALGTLCVIDHVPRTLTPMQQEALGVLSRQVMAHLEIRRQTHELAGTSETLTAVTEALAAYVERGDWKEAMGRLLRCAIDQTQSEYGFIGVVVGSTLRVLAHEGIVWDKIANRDFYEQALRNYEKAGYLEFTNFNNLFGRAITTGKVVIANMPDSDPRSSGRPTGHPPMRSFLGVPIFVRDEVLGLVALANRPGGYSENEQRRIETLVQHAGGLCASYRQRETALVLAQERVKAEAALAQAEANRRAVWQSSIDGIITMDESGHITDFNPAAEKVFGYRAADVIGHSLADKIIPPALREGHRRGMAKFLATGQGPIMGRRIELSALRSDGTEFPVELTVVTVTGAERPTFLGTVRDITERKRAEEALRASEAQFRQLAESNILGLVFWNVQGNISDANDAFLEMVGYTREELRRGQIDWRSMTPPEYLPADERALQEIAATGSCAPFEKEYFHKDGRRVAILVGAAALDGAKDRGICYVVDISQQKQAEAKVSEAAQLANLRAEIATQLTAPLALPDITRGVCELLVRHLGMAFARVWTLNEAEQVLELQASAGLYTHLDGPHARVPMGQFKIGRIAQNRKPHLTNDVPNDTEISDPAWAQREGMVAFAGYPLMIEGRVLGVVGMFSRHAFSEQIFGELPPLADWIAQCIQRKRDEATLRVSEERFRLLAKATNDAIWDWNLTTNHLWWNEGYEKLFGYSRAEVAPTSKSWTDHIHPEDLLRVTDGIHHVIEHGGEDWSDEYRFRCQDGRYSHVLDRGHVIRNAAGQPVRMIGGMTDVTKLKEHELALLQSNRALQLLSRCNEALIRSETENGLLETICQIAVDVGGFRLAWVGYAREDAAKTIEVQSHAGVEEGYLAKLCLTWAENDPAGQGPPGRVIRHGEPVIISDLESDESFRPWREAAQARGFCGVIALPLTGQKRTFGVLVLYLPEVRQPLPDEMRLLRELADDLAFGIVTIRAHLERQRMQSAVVQVATAVSAATNNDFFEQLARSMAAAVGAQAGFVAQMLPGEPLTARTIAAVVDNAVAANFDYVLHGTPCENFLTSDTCVIHQQAAQQFPKSPSLAVLCAQGYVGRRLDSSAGKFLGLLFVIFREPLHETDFVTSTLQIFSARAAAELERQLLEEQLRQSQKMEAIGQLAGGVAHDFNNILAVMMMQAELTGMVENLPDQVQDGLREIRVAAERAANLTRQLLLFSRKQVLQSRQLDLNEVVTSLAKMLQRIIGDDVRLQLNLHPRPLLTRADAGMLDQVLMNLVVNARDAMPGGGQLFIETSEHAFTAAEAAAIPDASPGRYVCLRVTDTGSGMPPEILARIFEPFFTTKEPGKGTGLGLSTVFGIVKQHNGAFTVESEVGKGTTFRLFLRAQETTAKSRAEAAVNPRTRGGTETILLVEDEPSVRMLTRVVLERAGYQVLQAAQGVEALKIWDQASEKIQLLLTDLVMPEGINGRELAARLREKSPGLRVIFTSGYSADIAGRELTLQEGQNFIQKPASPQQLLETVRRSLDA